MKNFVLPLLAFLLTLSALVVETPYVDLDDVKASVSTLQRVPAFQSEILRNDTKSAGQKKVHFAQDFMAIILLADIPNPNNRFIHYLPLHGKVRPKDYFLLI